MHVHGPLEDLLQRSGERLKLIRLLQDREAMTSARQAPLFRNHNPRMMLHLCGRQGRPFRSLARRDIRIAARLACLKIDGMSTVSRGVCDPSLAGPRPTRPSTSFATKLMSPAPRLAGSSSAIWASP